MVNSTLVPANRVKSDCVYEKIALEFPVREKRSSVPPTTPARRRLLVLEPGHDAVLHLACHAK